MSKTIPPFVLGSPLLRTAFFGATLFAGLGFTVNQPVEAAGFSGICPVLGTTQPAYPTPFEPPLPPDPSAPIPVTIALPQEPVRVNVDGKEYPICAVYMSINDSLQLVADQIPIADLPRPGETPNDILFPDLRSQPWNQKPGANEAVAFSDNLSANGFWDLPISPPSSEHYTWIKDGFNLLVNENPKHNKNESEYSPYFLWDFGPVASSTEGKAQAVYFNEKSGKWQNDSNKRLDPNQKHWYWVIDAPGTDVPGPLPLLGAGAAFGWSRRLRQRLRQGRLAEQPA